MLFSLGMLKAQNRTPLSTFGPYADCVIGKFQELICVKPTPERMEIALKGVCVTERKIFREDSINYFLWIPGNLGVDAVHRIVKQHIAGQQSNLVGRYAHYFSTGR